MMKKKRYFVPRKKYFSLAGAYNTTRTLFSHLENMFSFTWEPYAACHGMSLGVAL